MEMEIDLENILSSNSSLQNGSNQRSNALIDINMNHDSYRKQESFSFSDEKNTIENTSSIIEDITIFSKFNYRRTQNTSRHNISTCEGRLIKDLEELKKNEKIGKFCKIIVHDYTQIQDSYNFEMIIEFVNYCSIKFVFPQIIHSYPRLFRIIRGTDCHICSIQMEMSF